MSDGKGFRFWGWVGLAEIGIPCLSSAHAALHAVLREQLAELQWLASRATIGTIGRL
jgi:hypothetical protein